MDAYTLGLIISLITLVAQRWGSRSAGMSRARIAGVLGANGGGGGGAAPSGGVSCCEGCAGAGGAATAPPTPTASDPSQSKPWAPAGFTETDMVEPVRTPTVFNPVTGLFEGGGF